MTHRRLGPTTALLLALLLLLPVGVAAQGADPTGGPAPWPDEPGGPAPSATPADPLSEPPSPPAPAGGTIRVVIDRPASGATTAQRFTISGWAVDPEAPGTGVDAVHVYLDGEAGRGYFLGAANYGEERLDVAQQLGQPRFGLAGYSLQVEVPPGPHTLYVYARRRGSAAGEVWSAPATVDIVATPAVTVPPAGRALPSGDCPRAPDGTCIGRTPLASPTCPQLGPEGQCLPAAARAVPPGWVGAPSTAAPANPGVCIQVDASGRCLTYANASAAPASGATLVLRAEVSWGLATLTWTPLPGAVTYELLRCVGAGAQSCSSVAVLSGTTYQLPQTANTWYVVQARGANGQVIAISNIVGPT